MFKGEKLILSNQYVIGVKKDSEEYPLASLMYGHRFMQGQDFREYLLEFFIVLLGINDSDRLENLTNKNEWKYKAEKKIGLRRFVFYKSEVKSQYKGDAIALSELEERLQNNAIRGGDVEQVRELLRSYLAVEDDRSWFAKSLYPVNKALLLPEAIRKNVAKLTYEEAIHPDKGIEFTQRNFLARGGELYYLMITAGVEGEPELKNRILTKLVSLVSDNHQEIEGIVQTIEDSWEDVQSKYKTETNSKLDEKSHSFSIGWLPDKDCKLFKQMAVELDRLLMNDINQLELLHLLNHLIAIHIMQYLYRRNSSGCDFTQSCVAQQNLSCCRPVLLIDAIENNKSGEQIRNLSARYFRQLDDQQEVKALQFVRDSILTWSQESQTVQDLENLIFTNLNIQDKHKKSLSTIISEFNINDNEFQLNEKVVDKLTRQVYGLYENNLKKHMQAVHRKLARQSGMLKPQTSKYQRWTMPDSILKTLVLCTMEPGQSMSIDNFVQELWYRYGFVIGPAEADLSKLSEEPIDRYHFFKNLQQFQNKLLNAGLAVQYSDATCIIQNHFHPIHV